jgi:bacteriorhodopsin
MHAAGAIVTKLIPFLMIGVGLAADAPAWSIWALVAIGLIEIATDVLWSTSSSDWKKFKREMSFVQPS